MVKRREDAVATLKQIGDWIDATHRALDAGQAHRAHVCCSCVKVYEDSLDEIDKLVRRALGE